MFFGVFLHARSFLITIAVWISNVGSDGLEHPSGITAEAEQGREQPGEASGGGAFNMSL